MLTAAQIATHTDTGHTGIDIVSSLITRRVCCHCSSLFMRLLLMVHLPSSMTVLWCCVVLLACCSSVFVSSAAPVPGTPLGAYRGSFKVPLSVVLYDGSAYVYDVYFGHLVQLNSTGSVTAFLPLPPPFAPSQAQLISGVAVDTAGLLYVADSGNARLVVMTSNGTVLQLVTGVLRRPSGVAVDPSGQRIYIADQLSNSVIVLAANGKVMANLTDLGLDIPRGIALDDTGEELFVVDGRNCRILVLAAHNGTQLRTLTYDGCRTPAGLAVRGDMVYVVDFSASKLFGLSSSNGSVLLSFPVWQGSGVSLDADGRFWVALGVEGTVHVFSHSGANLATYAGGDFPRPMKLAVDSAGLIYIGDLWHDQVVVLNADGSLVRIIGKGLAAFCLAVGKDGSVFICHGDNSIVQLAADSTVVRRFYNLSVNDVAVDGDGRLHVAVEHVGIYVFAANGTQLHWFNASYLNDPYAVTVGSDGRIYVGVCQGVRCQSRPLIVLAHNGTLLHSYGLDVLPIGVALDAAGRIYVANVDIGNPVVQVLSADGTTLYSMPKLNGTINVWGCALTADGNVLLGDMNGGQVPILAGIPSVGDSKAGTHSFTGLSSAVGSASGKLSALFPAPSAPESEYARWKELGGEGDRRTLAPNRQEMWSAPSIG